MHPYSQSQNGPGGQSARRPQYRPPISRLDQARSRRSRLTLTRNTRDPIRSALVVRFQGQELVIKIWDEPTDPSGLEVDRVRVTCEGSPDVKVYRLELAVEREPDRYGRLAADTAAEFLDYAAYHGFAPRRTWAAYAAEDATATPPATAAAEG